MNTSIIKYGNRGVFDKNDPSGESTSDNGFLTSFVL